MTEITLLEFIKLNNQYGDLFDKACNNFKEINKKYDWAQVTANTKSEFEQIYGVNPDSIYCNMVNAVETIALSTYLPFPVRSVELMKEHKRVLGKKIKFPFEDQEYLSFGKVLLINMSSAYRLKRIDTGDIVFRGVGVLLLPEVIN